MILQVNFKILILGIIKCDQKDKFIETLKIGSKVLVFGTCIQSKDETPLILISRLIPIDTNTEILFSLEILLNKSK